MKIYSTHFHAKFPWPDQNFTHSYFYLEFNLLKKYWLSLIFTKLNFLLKKRLIGYFSLWSQNWIFCSKIYWLGTFHLNSNNRVLYLHTLVVWLFRIFTQVVRRQFSSKSFYTFFAIFLEIYFFVNIYSSTHFHAKFPWPDQNFTYSYFYREFNLLK